MKIEIITSSSASLLQEEINRKCESLIVSNIIIDIDISVQNINQGVSRVLYIGVIKYKVDDRTTHIIKRR